ncbi:ABC transporter substrate-binding protein [Chelatococcus sp. SYSU_G07232]|uniref:ABC transporter substrate-binding protein n=1 Tax=Chelatococcus albus TaxID=3047466 RepID=A0ABT7AFB1_9HYPH|nr:ABC transporter substrate-binding protein [Chelatococcus sp. SYSU_G07232]MDJ1158068.1 ABC transporter substrate-binding protein [Chelatococcus sp. SYSU_G07232]
MKVLKTTFAALAGLAALTAAHAQSGGTIKLANVAELSGPGATVGTNWKNGIDLAVAEINEKGGILGRKLEVTHADSQSNPGIARAQVQKALDGEPYVLLGPGYSGSVKVTASLAQQAEVPQIMGGEAAELTKAGHTHLFRTSFGQQSSMPKVAAYLADDLKAKSVAVVWVNNDFGKGGRDVITAELQKRNVKVAADISTEAGQADFAADVAKVKASGADAAFIYLNEEESARILKEIKRQNLTLPLIGETTLVGQKVIDLAGEAANGARGHVGLTTDAPVPAIQQFREKFQKRYNYVPDHNGLKGYLAVYVVKAVTEKMGKVDRKAFADTLHGLTISAAQEPGILMDVTYDKNGDIDRQGFLVEVENGRQVVKKVLPKLGN